MDAARYVVGVLLVVGVPPAIVFWLLIHPLAGWWRRVGSMITYLVVAGSCTALGWGAFVLRDAILGKDLGTNWSLLPVAAILYLVSAWLSFLAKRHLKMKIFVGLPEIAGDGREGLLLQDGIYGVIRHPRYVAVILGTTGVALFVNYVGGYLVVLGAAPALYLVGALEEQELVQRFGDGYRAYRSRVPAVFPRILGRSADS